MTSALRLALLLCLASLAAPASDRRADHQWLTGKIVDANRARHLAMIQHSGQSSTTTSGSMSGTGQSTAIGDNSTTNINGSYSGTSSTTYSGSEMPLYRVYENLIIEGDDMVYVTQERIRWRWSKAAHVTVNGEVKYYVDKRKLHVLDDDGKEHIVQIAEQIKKIKPASDAPKPVPPASAAPAPAASNAAPTSATPAQLQVSSTPDGADIEIDGNFVGSTPSTVGMSAGQHQLVVKKTGFKPWERKITVSSGQVKVNAALEPEQK